MSDTLSSGPKALTVVEPLVLQSTDPKRSVLPILPPEAAAQAGKLAGEIILENPIALLNFGAPARGSLTKAAEVIIGDTRLGEASEIANLFSRFNTLPTELNVQELRAPPKGWQQLVMMLPWIGKLADPVFRFVNRYRKFSSVIDGLISEVAEVEVTQTSSIVAMTTMAEANLANFRQLEIAIAAGEIARDREYALFNQRRDVLTGSQDFVELQKLKEMGDRINQLDNRIMTLQVARGDAMLVFPMLQLSIEGARRIVQAAAEIRTTTVSQIKTGAAIALSTYNRRAAVQLLGNVDALNEALRKENLKMLALEQEELHGAEMRSVRQADSLVADYDKILEIVKRGNELIAQQAELRTKARAALSSAETRLTEGLKNSLKDVTGT